ncbi:hypothetical protein DL89DRAFT_269245 [Linderina pennispora]|uniref:Phytanoyl-CoA dioxygenase n=1 Tax=Linderina pennispora TaxID=61395 RepID=A0A1Y1W2E1_9FUNG|nr:uncharacterized protein DL89DRAFT_269245 [Linderina pennispora]ORX67426.1 hypothetical protein DL89DRAFT_269245 [Linderina pennispora]
MLTREQVQFYAEHGYLIVEGFLTEREIGLYREESELLVNHCYECGDLVDSWGCIVEPLGSGYLDTAQITNTVRSDRSFYEQARSQIHKGDLVTCTLLKYGQCAMQLLNKTDTAYLLNEQYIVKPPRSKTKFEWHQDILYFKPEERKHAIVSAWSPLDNVSEGNGTVCVEPNKRSGKQPFWANMAAGSVLFMDGRLRHCSSGNTSANSLAAPVVNSSGGLVAFGVPV